MPQFHSPNWCHRHRRRRCVKEKFPQKSEETLRPTWQTSMATVWRRTTMNCPCDCKWNQVWRWEILEEWPPCEWWWEPPPTDAIDFVMTMSLIFPIHWLSSSSEIPFETRHKAADRVGSFLYKQQKNRKKKMKIKVSTNDKQCLNENLCRCLILDRNGWDLRDNPVGSYWCSTIHDAVAPEWHYTLWDVAVVEIPTMPVWLVCAPPTRTSIVFYIHTTSRKDHVEGIERGRKKKRERK